MPWSEAFSLAVLPPPGIRTCARGTRAAEFGVRVPSGVRTPNRDSRRNAVESQSEGAWLSASRGRGCWCQSVPAVSPIPARPAGRRCRGRWLVRDDGLPRMRHAETRPPTRLGRGDDDRDSPATQPPDVATHRRVAIRRPQHLQPRSGESPFRSPAAVERARRGSHGQRRSDKPCRAAIESVARDRPPTPLYLRHNEVRERRDGGAALVGRPRCC